MSTISYDATLPKSYGNATATAGANLAGYSQSTNLRTPKQQLGQEDFLKLLATQFQQQDPMKPMEDTAFIAQMAQFSSLEQMNSLSSEMSRVRADGQLQAATAMLGQTVQVDLGDSKTADARIDSIDTTTSPPRLISGDKIYALDDVIKIYAEAPVVTPAPTTNPS